MDSELRCSHGTLIGTRCGKCQRVIEDAINATIKPREISGFILIDTLGQPIIQMPALKLGDQS